MFDWLAFDSSFAAIGAVIYACVYAFAIYNAYRILASNQQPANAFAWLLFHAFIPFAAVPAYAIFGRRRLTRYPRWLQPLHPKGSDPLAESSYLSEDQQQVLAVLHGLAPDTRLSFNQIGLLINGDATFSAIFAAISTAKQCILIQYYILRSDRLGAELKDLLIIKAKEGVQVYILYDGFGSFWLSSQFVFEVRSHGIHIARFLPVTKLSTLSHLNFRNHRKLVLIDGRMAFTGGLNVGDEYLGGGKRFRSTVFWRDTHIQLEGPVVTELCYFFAADWQFTTGKDLPLANLFKERTNAPSSEQIQVPKNLETPRDLSSALVKHIPSGPTDERSTGELMFLEMIMAAKKRLWIATPYFVPGKILRDALVLAQLRGVDIRILIPSIPDHILVFWATNWLAMRVSAMGIKFYLYRDGFMHQKIVLIDQDWAIVGSSNFDQRATELNFETNLIISHCPSMLGQLEQMLEADFAKSLPMH
jgi:cardiolipin synthase